MASFLHKLAADRPPRGRSQPLEKNPGIVAKALTKQHKRSQTAEAELAFAIPAEPRRHPFDGYGLGAPYDEMFGRDSRQRPQYQILHERLQELGPDELLQRQQRADLSFLNQGITFTVYGQQESTERVMPTDLLPRILTAKEWATIEAGLTQRIEALNLFLKDIYNEGKILADGIIPRELVYSAQHYRREMRELAVPRDVYVAVCGTDLVRLPDGGFAVLEDNLRVPSGVSYMLANREVMKHVFPELFRNYAVKPISKYCQALLATLRQLAPAGARRSDHRRADPRHLQLGLFRACLPGAPDGHPAGRGQRSRRP